MGAPAEGAPSPLCNQRVRPGGTLAKLNSPFAVADVVRLSLPLPDRITSLVAIKLTLMESAEHSLRRDHAPTNRRHRHVLKLEVDARALL